jgi:hypothetical protein
VHESGDIWAKETLKERGRKIPAKALTFMAELLRDEFHSDYDINKENGR